MIEFDVLNRFSGAVQFTADIDCDKDERRSIKLGLAVRWATKTGASLYGASLDGASGINEYVKCIQVEIYPITYTAEVMQIGRQRHAIDKWREFDDEAIISMDGKSALKFWRKYKDWIFQTIEMVPAKSTQSEAQS